MFYINLNYFQLLFKLFLPWDVNFKVWSPFNPPKIFVMSQEDCSGGFGVVGSGSVTPPADSILNQTHLRAAHVPEEFDNQLNRQFTTKTVSYSKGIDIGDIISCQIIVGNFIHTSFYSDVALFSPP